MKIKYLLIAGLILAILMIGAASASDANDTIGNEDQQILADSPKTFTELEIDINRTTTHSTAKAIRDMLKSAKAILQ